MIDFTTSDLGISFNWNCSDAHIVMLLFSAAKIFIKARILCSQLSILTYKACVLFWSHC